MPKLHNIPRVVENEHIETIGVLRHSRTFHISIATVNSDIFHLPEFQIMQKPLVRFHHIQWVASLRCCTEDLFIILHIRSGKSIWNNRSLGGFSVFRWATGKERVAEYDCTYFVDGLPQQWHNSTRSIVCIYSKVSKSITLSCNTNIARSLLVSMKLRRSQQEIKRFIPCSYKRRIF